MTKDKHDIEEQNKERINIRIDTDLLEWVEAVEKRFNMNRSQVISKCIADTRETLCMMDSIGFKPERIAKIADSLVRMWAVPILGPVSKKA